MIVLSAPAGLSAPRPTPPISQPDRAQGVRPVAETGGGASAAASPPAAAPATPPVQPVAAIRRLQAQEAAQSTSGPSAGPAPAGATAGGPGDIGLTEQEQAAVEQLKARDREVRAHEQAHAAVGGQYASAPTYEYEVGPDGHRYAVGGEVQIDTAPVPDDPEATIEKMEIVKAAALAPAEPSAQDRKVAQMADQQRAQAQAQLFAERAEHRAGGGEEADQSGAAGVGGDAARHQEAATGYDNGRAAQAAAQIVEIVAAA